MAEMTRREAMNVIISGTITDELVEWATEEVAKLDATNAKRKEKVTEKKAANIELAKSIISTHLGAEPKSASEIAAEAEISTQKVSALFRMDEVADLIVKSDMKVKGKGIVKGYAKA